MKLFIFYLNLKSITLNKMIDLIIGLLIALGVNLNETAVEVVDERTGISYGVGSNATVNNSEIDPPRYILVMDDRESRINPKLSGFFVSEGTFFVP